MTKIDKQLIAETQAAFNVYLKAVLCSATSLLTDFDDAPEPSKCVKSLCGVIEQSPLSDVKQIFRTVDNLDVLLGRLYQHLPPPFRVDWILRWKEIPLTFDAEIRKALENERPDCWQDFHAEIKAQEPLIGDALYRYAYKEDKYFKGIDIDHPYPEYFRRSEASGFAMLTVRPGETPLRRLLRLAPDYWRLCDECAYIHFLDSPRPKQFISQPTGTGPSKDPRQAAKDYRERHNRLPDTTTQMYINLRMIYSEIAHIVADNLDLLFPEEPPRQPFFLLPKPPNYTSLDAWRRACIVGPRAPVPELEKRIDIALTATKLIGASAAQDSTDIAPAASDPEAVCYRISDDFLTCAIGEKTQTITERQSEIFRVLHEKGKSQGLTNTQIKKKLPKLFASTFRDVKRSFEGTNANLIGTVIIIKKTDDDKNIYFLSPATQVLQ